MDLILSYRQVSLFSLYFRATYSRVLMPMHKRIILLRVREDREPRVLNYNLYSKLVHRVLWTSFVSTFRAIVMSVLRIRHHDNERSIRRINRIIHHLYLRIQPEEKEFLMKRNITIRDVE